jgi:CheY-like chemotaxis protein
MVGVAGARSAARSCGRSAEAGRPIHILLVDDNPADTRLTIETLRDDKILNDLSVVTDGELALRFLRREPPYAQATRPDLLLVDLTLPRRDGPELVAEMRSDPELRSIPVALLAASAVEQELLSASVVPADFCVRKPVDLQQLMRIVGQVGEFGITVVTMSESTPNAFVSARLEPLQFV